MAVLAFTSVVQCASCYVFFILSPDYRGTIPICRGCREQFLENHLSNGDHVDLVWR